MRMRELGVRIVSGLDAGPTPTKQHGALWRVVVQLESAGFSPAEALATATSVAADDCGLTGTTGRPRCGCAGQRSSTESASSSRAARASARDFSA